MKDPVSAAPSPLDAAITRRRLLQLSAAAGVATFIAACGTSGTRTPGASGTSAPATGTPVAMPSAAPTPVSGVFRMASWIGYIDASEDNLSHPSLDRFADETGIQVDYQEAVNDDEEFFGSQLKAPLESGVATGWDVVVLSDWMIIRLIGLGWLEEIAAGNAFPANLVDIYKAREWDKGNRFAAPWQAGMTGIGYDKTKTGDLSSLDVFFTDTYAGKMTYLTEMRDTIGLAALHLGADPGTLTRDQFDAALALIKDSVDNSLVTPLTGNSYVQDMSSGDVTVAMAWSGDVATLLIPEQKRNQDFQWALATEGGMLWTVNMCIPKGARNKAQAEVFIDWYYQPANAAEIEAAVNYVCPVKGADEEMLKIHPELSANPLIFPTREMYARLHQFTALDVDTTSDWEAAFASATGP